MKNSNISLPKLTVLMAVWNDARFLNAAIESILNQSFQDFEFIIIDDGSDDSTWNIIQKYSTNCRIVPHQNDKNLGLTKSLNIGLSMAKGEYLARLDSDEIALPGRLQSQVHFLDNNPDIGLLGGGYQIIDSENRISRVILRPTNDEELKAELLFKNHSIAHGTVIVRTALLREVNGYDDNYKYAQDYDLWVRLAEKTRFSSLPVPLMQWRDTKNNISYRHRDEQLTCALNISIRYLKRIIDEHAMDWDAYRRIWWSYHGYLDRYDIGDLEKVEALWGALESRRGLITRTAQGFSQLGLNLIRSNLVSEGMLMLTICRKRFNVHPGYTKIIKSYLRGKMFS
jgi:glycosyltransferase involved in cell wall biosynthesis